MENNGRVWICCGNDLETNETIKMLDKQDENCIFASKVQGISWRNLRPAIQNLIRRKSKEGSKIYGIGMSDRLLGVDTYNITSSMDTENGKLSSLDVISELLDVKLSIDQQFISSYLKEGKNGVYKLADKLGIGDSGNGILEYIQIRDRQAKKILIRQEAEAVRALQNKREILDGNIGVIKLPHNKIEAIIDRSSNDNLLVLCPNEETYFLGDKKYIHKLEDKFNNDSKSKQLRNI